MTTEQLHGETFTSALAGVGLASPGEGAAASFEVLVLPAQELSWESAAPLTARWLEPGLRCELAVRGVGRFVVSASRVEAFPAPGVREDALRLFLRYHAVGLRMRLAGFVVLHGAAVSLSGRAHVWVGVSGEGKTSAALEACAAGARFLADEVVVLREHEGAFLVRRGVPWPRVETGAPMALHAMARASLTEEAAELPLAQVALPRAEGRPGEAARLAAQILGGYRPELVCTAAELAVRERLLAALRS